MSEPTLAEIFREASDSRLSDVHVAMPGRVVSYDRATSTANVLPMVRRAISDNAGATQHEELPVIPNVRVLFPKGGAFNMTWDLEAGDFVLLVICSSAIGHWRETGDVADPVDLRRHDLSHAVAIPGIGAKANVLPVDPAGVPLITVPLMKIDGSLNVGILLAEAVALASKVETFLGDLATSIQNGVPGGADGGAALQTSILGLLAAAGWTAGGTTPPTTASSNLKAKP